MKNNKESDDIKTILKDVAGLKALKMELETSDIELRNLYFHMESRLNREIVPGIEFINGLKSFLAFSFTITIIAAIIFGVYSYGRHAGSEGCKASECKIEREKK